MTAKVRLFMCRRRFWFLTIGLLINLTVCSTVTLNSEAQTASYPVKGITIIYPFAAGTAAGEVFSRAIAPIVSKKFGVPVEILPKPGGNATIGTREVMKARPDGYTLLVDNPGSSSLQKALGSELPYKIEERTYMVRGVDTVSAIYVPAVRPWRTLKDVEDAIRKDPANFKWATAGGNHSDFAMYLFQKALRARGVDLSQTKKVPFVSSVLGHTAVAGGHVDIYAATLSSIQAFWDAKKIRVIAVVHNKSSKFYPGVPTTVEQGYDVVTHFWVGYSGPPGLPNNVVEKWVNVVKGITDDPANSSIFDQVGGEPAFLAGEDLKKFVLDEAKEVEKMAAEIAGGK